MIIKLVGLTCLSKISSSYTLAQRYAGCLSRICVILEVTLQIRLQHPSVLLYGLFASGNQISIIIAFTLISLEDVYSLAALAPLLVTSLTSVYHQTTLHYSTYLFICIGMFGAFLIINPTFESISLGHLFALISVFCGACRDTCANIFPNNNRFFMQLSAFSFTLMFGIVFFGLPAFNEVELAVYATFILIGIIAYLGLRFQILALGYKHVQYAAFARYSQIVFGILSSYFIFNTYVDYWDWVGVAFIFCGGYLLLRQNS